MAYTATGVDTIERTLQKTNEWLKQVAEELKIEDRHEALKALRSVLHALRDRLPVEEAADLGGQLPLLIRGLYYENWEPARTPLKIRKPEEFLARLREEFQPDPGQDMERLTRAVLRVLKSRISAGEIDDVLSNLPQDLRPLWD